MVDEVGAIVGGCVAGGLVFFVILGIIVYHAVCKRKHRKRRDHDKFHPITPQTSPSHSQPSTLGIDGRLPKVNSTGLWVGAPSMYTGAAPSPAYYYGPSKGSSKQAQPHPGMITKASSETRIQNSGLHYAPSRPIYGSHGNLLITPGKHRSAPPPPPPRRATSMPKVPVVGVQPRIYHSSQPLAPVFEVPRHASPAMGLEIYDVYQFGGGNSRSKLVEEKHSKHYYDERAFSNSRLGRSQSDVQEKTKKPNRHSRSRDSSSSKQAPKVNRSSSSNSRDRGPQQHPQQRPRNSRHAPEPPRPSSSSVILQQHNRSNSKEFRLSSSAPGYRIGMKSKSLDSLDDNLSRSSFGGGNYNKAFDSGGRVSSVSGEIILVPAAPIPPKVATPSVISSSTPRSNIILPNGVISGNVSSSYTGFPDKATDKNSHGIVGVESAAQIDTSATDSMKLLAKNKTDDQKTVVAVGTPASSEVNGNYDDEIDDVIDIVEDTDLSKGHIHYTYQGDIYAVPGKNISPTDDLNENPIISRMKEMVVEKARTNSTKSMSHRSYHQEENGEIPSSTHNTPRSFHSTSADDIIVDTEYQEIGDIIKSMETHSAGNDVVVENGGPSKLNGELELTNGNNVHDDVIDSALANGVNSKLNGDGVENGGFLDTTDGGFETGNQSAPMSPVKLRNDNNNDNSKTADTTFEEINNAGKRITASAFEFLNTYLSDDEGGDGQMSP